MISKSLFYVNVILVVAKGKWEFDLKLRLSHATFLLSIQLAFEDYSRQAFNFEFAGVQSFLFVIHSCK